VRAEGVRKDEWVSVVGENHQQPRPSDSQQRRNTRADDETGGPGAKDSQAFTCPAGAASDELKEAYMPAGSGAAIGSAAVNYSSL
jgi:hypothetical protein